MHIRMFVPRDAKEISGVVKDSLGESYAPSLYLTIHNVFPEGFLVLEADGRIVGFVASVISGPKVARILMLAVLPEFRGRSHGSMLMDALYSSCLAKGIDTLVLEVRKSNTRARRFYERQGFNVTGEIRCFYTNGEDAYKMSRSVLT